MYPGDAYATFNIRFNDRHSSNKLKKKYLLRKFVKNINANLK